MRRGFFIGAAALVGGLLLASYAMRPKPFEGVKVSSYNMADVPRHPITEEMMSRAEARLGDQVPDLTLPSTDGKDVVLRELSEKGPLVIVMTKDGCPCSIESQPYFSQVAAAYAKDVTFLGIIEGDFRTARKYQGDFNVPYEFAYVDSQDVFKQFGAKQSVYTYLVGKGGQIRQIWPGYSRHSLTELNAKIANELGKTPVIIDFSSATEEMTSGCFFFQPIGTNKPAWHDETSSSD
ncbi:redoxin domain-containing protein [Kamptonema cortianum]|nr:redoxin domain-containing protein [Geitlerinema splendidum]MDK3161019.1 redoxin domain-containing protein [Kamptonema cortianum]